MDDAELLTKIIFLYLIISVVIHAWFFLTTIFNSRLDISNQLRCFYSRWMTAHVFVKKVNTDMHHSCLNTLNNERLTTTDANKLSTLSSSTIGLESETLLMNRMIRSFGFILCTCLLLTNWLRLGIYLYPNFYPNAILQSSTMCTIQSFFLHVLTLFHIKLTVFIRLLWHYCFVVNKYWQTVTYCCMLKLTVFILIASCVFTWPSISDDWASIVFDRTLHICIVDYTFRLSYTFFVLSFTCIIPFTMLFISHQRQTKCIKQRMLKYNLTIQPYEKNLYVIQQEKRFRSISSCTLIWSLVNMLFLICIHIPIRPPCILKLIVYYAQIFILLIDPILYTYAFRSLSIITLLRPTDDFEF